MYYQKYFTKRQHYSGHTLAHTLPSRIKFSLINETSQWRSHRRVKISMLFFGSLCFSFGKNLRGGANLYCRPRRVRRGGVAPAAPPPLDLVVCELSNISYFSGISAKHFGIAFSIFTIRGKNSRRNACLFIKYVRWMYEKVCQVFLYILGYSETFRLNRERPSLTPEAAMRSTFDNPDL